MKLSILPDHVGKNGSRNLVSGLDVGSLVCKHRYTVRVILRQCFFVWRRRRRHRI